jgi:hypothetical protein
MTPRWAQRLDDAAAFTAAAVIVAGGIGYSVLFPTHWWRGVFTVAVGLLVAAGLRAGLPRQRAGLLVVRSRWFDVACFAVLGGGVLLFGFLAPR